MISLLYSEIIERQIGETAKPTGNYVNDYIYSPLSAVTRACPTVSSSLELKNNNRLN